MKQPISSKPKKQRKYLLKLQMHQKKKVLSAHLSKELKKELGKRSMPLRKNDKVKVVRGKASGTIGKIMGVNRQKNIVTVENVKRKKADGKEIFVPLKASNLVIIELDRTDAKRIKSKSGKKHAKEEKK